MPSHNEQFVQRNFTVGEITYCRQQPNPAASFAARWAAKEAIFKSFGTTSHGSSAPMKEIEIVSSNGVPKVELHGNAKEAALSKGISAIHISLSHSEVRCILVPLLHGSFIHREPPLLSHKLLVANKPITVHSCIITNLEFYR